MCLVDVIQEVHPLLPFSITNTSLKTFDTLTHAINVPSTYDTHDCRRSLIDGSIGPFFGNARMLSPKSNVVSDDGPIPFNTTNTDTPLDINHLRDGIDMMGGLMDRDRLNSQEKSEKVSGEFLKSIFETLSARSSPAGSS